MRDAPRILSARHAAIFLASSSAPRMTFSARPEIAGLRLGRFPESNALLTRLAPNFEVSFRGYPRPKGREVAARAERGTPARAPGEPSDTRAFRPTRARALSSGARESPRLPLPRSQISESAGESARPGGRDKTRSREPTRRMSEGGVRTRTRAEVSRRGSSASARTGAPARDAVAFSRALALRLVFDTGAVAVLDGYRRRVKAVSRRCAGAGIAGSARSCATRTSRGSRR